MLQGKQQIHQKDIKGTLSTPRAANPAEIMDKPSGHWPGQSSEPTMCKYQQYLSSLVTVHTDISVQNYTVDRPHNNVTLEGLSGARFHMTIRTSAATSYPNLLKCKWHLPITSLWKTSAVLLGKSDLQSSCVGQGEHRGPSSTKLPCSTTNTFPDWQQQGHQFLPLFCKWLSCYYLTRSKISRGACTLREIGQFLQEKLAGGEFHRAIV